MKLTQNGLTVGELTIAISALILGGLIWTAINKEDNSQVISNNYVSILDTLQVGNASQNPSKKIKP